MIGVQESERSKFFTRGKNSCRNLKTNMQSILVKIQPRTEPLDRFMSGDVLYPAGGESVHGQAGPSSPQGERFWLFFASGWLPFHKPYSHGQLVSHPVETIPRGVTTGPGDFE